MPKVLTVEKPDEPEPEEQYACRYCGKTFKSFPASRAHETLTHAAERMNKLESAMLSLANLVRANTEIHGLAINGLFKELEELRTSQRDAVVDLREKLLQILGFLKEGKR